jgi:hypothetical protein
MGKSTKRGSTWTCWDCSSSSAQSRGCSPTALERRALDETAVEEFGEDLSGEVFGPNDDGYDEAPTIWNAMIDRQHGGEPDGSGDVLDGFVADVTTIAQSQCEHCEDYADIETLVCHLPIEHLTFAAHDSLAPYSGPYPLTRLVRAFIIKEINGWDETALHDHLQANPSLRRRLGFESLPNQSTFWRGWNHRCSKKLRDAVAECADKIVTTARACDVSLPERIEAGRTDKPEATDCPERQLLAQKTDEVWQQAKPFVTDAFKLDRGPNWEIHENAFWEQHAYMGMREDMYARSGPASFSLDTTRDRIPTGSTHRCPIRRWRIQYRHLNHVRIASHRSRGGHGT